MRQHKTIEYPSFQMVRVCDFGVFAEHGGVMLYEGVLSTSKNDRLVFFLAQRRKAHDHTRWIWIGDDNPQVRSLLGARSWNQKRVSAIQHCCDPASSPVAQQATENFGHLIIQCV